MSLSSRLPPARGPRQGRPAPQLRSSGPPQPPVRPKPAVEGPPPGMRERRRHRRGRLSRLLTAPFPTTAFESRVRSLIKPVLGVLFFAAPVLCIAALAWVVSDAWSRRTPMLQPRHRAEALCFALASPPAFTPPMTIEPGAALMRGRFTPTTPPALALREVMQFDDRMVIRERTRTVGDFEIATLWLRLPGPTRHCLVVGWMEGSDLAVCSFRFAGDNDDLTADETLWGDRLLSRILVPANFRAGLLPAVRLKASRDGMLPSFGPKLPS